MDATGRPPSVTVSDEQNVAVDIALLSSAAGAALVALGVPPKASVSITLVDPARIARLKGEAFGIHHETDVLAFPMDDPSDPMPGPIVLGELVICPAVAARQARGLGIAFADEMRHLVVHGLLHLCGRDHVGARAELAMAAEERLLLAVGA